MHSRSPNNGALYAFTPDPVRGAMLDMAVRAGLAGSLRTIFENFDQSLKIERQSEFTLLQAIEAAPVRPRVFGAYVDLVMALFEEHMDDAQALLDELISQPPAAREAWRVVTLDDWELGAGQSARYRRLVSDDVSFNLGPVRPDSRGGAIALLNSALVLLCEGAPDVFAELRALVREVVLVSGRTETDGQVLGGASTFALWGAVFQNVDQRCDRLTVALSLAHEAAHMLLFGLAHGGRLVENDDDERFPSPLRRDSRPMEGIVHATYVLARMIYTLRALLESGRLDASEAAKARLKLRQHTEAYEAGQEVVMAHAQFKPAGAAAFEQARLYMDFAVEPPPLHEVGRS